MTVAPGSPPLALEEPTDADAFYDAVVRVQNGGRVLNPGSTSGVSLFHYHPMAYYFFLPLAAFGYVAFKFAMLGVSLVATFAGTALVLRAERDHVNVAVSDRAIAALALFSCGFGPLVSNYKTAQVSPIMYAFVCVCWWGYRRHRDTTAGVAIALASLFKPYVVAPVALGANPRRWKLAGVALASYAVLTVAAVIRFGRGTMVEYVGLLADALSSQSGASVSALTSASNLQLFAWLGPIESPVRVLALAPLGYVVLAYALADDESAYAPAAFGATLLSIFVIATETTAIDLPLLLPALLVVGLHAYAESDRFVVVVAAFLLFHVHPATLEVLVGAGATYVPVIAANQPAIRTVLPVVQPGLYGFVALYWGVFDVARPLPSPARLVRGGLRHPGR